MYMGVILAREFSNTLNASAPHVYGGDPVKAELLNNINVCSPCIWG